MLGRASQPARGDARIKKRLFVLLVGIFYVLAWYLRYNVHTHVRYLGR